MQNFGITCMVIPEISAQERSITKVELTMAQSNLLKDQESDRHVAAIRAHRPGLDVDRTYDMLKRFYSPNDIYIVVDETKNKKFSWNDDYNLVMFNESSLAELSLHVPSGKVGWLCGDYFYICLKEAVDFDYALLIEPDVAVNFDFNEILSEIKSRTVDLVGAGILERDKSWSWYQSMAQTGHDRVHSVFYPLTRMSRKLIDLIHEERIRSSKLFVPGSTLQYPNDEAVTGTVSFESGCSYIDLKSMYPGMFSHFLWGAKWLYPDVMKNFDSKKVVHPVLEESQFASYLRQELRKNRNSLNLSKIGTSLWSVEASQYSRWKTFILEELDFLVSDSTFNR